MSKYKKLEGTVFELECGCQFRTETDSGVVTKIRSCEAHRNIIHPKISKVPKKPRRLEKLLEYDFLRDEIET